MATNPPIPQFGVPLTPQQLNAELPFSVQYGVTPANQYIPLQVNNDGQLAISGVTITGPVTVTDVTIKGVDPANGNTSEDVAVVNWGLNGYALRTSLFYDGYPLLVNPNGSINVNLQSTSAGVPSNDYVENLAVPPNATTTLYTYTVPSSSTFNLTGFVGWGSCDGEFLVTVNGANVGGGFSSPTNRTLKIDYGTSPIIATAGSIITITISPIDYVTTTQTFRLNVLGELLA